MINIAIAACLLLGGTVTLDDVVKLNKAGVGDQIIIDHLKAQKAEFNLSTDDIIKLKENSVGEKVIQFMIASTAKESSREKNVPPAKKTRLVLSNQETKPLSIMIDENAKRIFYYFGNMNDRIVLGKNESKELAPTEGLYTVRWVGEEKSWTMEIKDGETAKIVTSPVEFTGYRATNIALFEGDSEKANGTLKIFEDHRSEAAEPKHRPDSQPIVQVQTPPTVIYRYIEPETYRVYRPDYYGTPDYRSYRRESPSFITPNTVLWSAVGAAAYRSHRWRGAGIGFLFGHLLDDVGSSRGCR